MNSSVSHLWELPVDVWAMIMESYLSSSDLVALRFSGSRALWQKLTMPGVVRRLTLSTDFPSSAAPYRFLLSLPNLKNLEIILSRTSSKTQQLLAPISTSLDSLSIFWSPEHYGRRWPSWSPSLLPPHLLTFRSNLPIYDSDFNHLPRSLTALELTRQNSVDGDGFRFLPPQLSHLRLFIASNHLETLKDNLIYLPKTLTSLELPYLSHVDEVFLSKLPNTLLQLNLSRVHDFSDHDVGLFPCALTHLNIKAASSLTNRSVLRLPPKLTFLCVQPNETNSKLTADAVRLLPSSLNSYWELPRSLQREYTRLYLQNQLEGGEVNASQSLPRWVASNLTDELMHMLPPDLHTLDLGNNKFITEHGILRVPMGLQRLYLPSLPDSPRWPGSLIKYLPRGLRDLDLPFVEDLQDSHIMKLPPNLTRLRICIESKSSPLRVRSFQFLPSQLKQLDVPMCFLQDIDINTALFKLPSTCQQITFGTGPGSVSLTRDSNNSFLRDTLKHRYFTPQTIRWVFEEVLKPLVSILGLVLITHLLFANKCFFWIPIAIAIIPTLSSSLLFFIQRQLDPDTSLFSWRPSTEIILPQLIVFGCYILLFLFYETRRPWSPW